MHAVSLRDVLWAFCRLFQASWKAFDTKLQQNPTNAISYNLIPYVCNTMLNYGIFYCHSLGRVLILKTDLMKDEKHMLVLQPIVILLQHASIFQS